MRKSKPKSLQNLRWRAPHPLASLHHMRNREADIPGAHPSYVIYQNKDGSYDIQWDRNKGTADDPELDYWHGLDPIAAQSVLIHLQTQSPGWRGNSSQ